ncbi:MAG: YcaO-like family protein [Thermodesulfobacteriota bacterium]
MRKRPIRLQDSFKTYTYDQDKTCPPTDTLVRFREALARVDLDILREVRRIDSGRLDIPVYFSVCGADARRIIGTKKQMGKGSTPEQSQASACMELAERFSFFAFKKSPGNFMVATYPQLQAQGLPVMELSFLLQSVHDTTTDLALLERILADIPIQWTWATNLSRQEEVLVPWSWFYAINEFNGPCAGNSVEEAILQGICEVVERHVSAVVSHDRIHTPAIDLASVTDPVCRELILKFTRHGILLYLNDFSLDTGIPTVGALAIDPATFPAKSEIVFTAGTTPSPTKALVRALTEVAQLAGDFDTEANYVASGLPKPASLDEVRYITEPAGSIRLDAMADASNANMRLEVENCLAALGRIGLEVFLVDVQHDALGIPAFYTIIPGCHFRERSRASDAGLFAAKLLAEQDLPMDEQNRRLERLGEALPRSYYVQFYLGRNHLSAGEPQEALDHFERALALSPQAEDLPYIYSYMGHCHKDLGDYRGAIAVLRQAERLDAEREDLYNLMGFCHFKLKEHETAIANFQRAIQLNPSSAIDYANLGANYRELGRTDEAVRFFQLALDLDPSIEFARTGLAALGASQP